MSDGSLGRRVRELRLRAGLGQAELATRAEISRQMLGALEAGRHLPRVDAALRLARALGTDVEALLAPDDAEVIAWDGRSLPDGTPVRVARVRDVPVAVPVADGDGGALFAAPDAVVRDRRAASLPGGEQGGLLVAGCDPALGLLAAAGPARGPGRLLPIVATTGEATAALLTGRIHAALVHDLAPPATPDGRRPVRLPFARWRTGLAVPAGTDLEAVLAGRTPVVQRASGASAQTAYERGAQVAPAAGPTATSHLDAARRSVAGGHAAVTIEPAAASLGLRFHPFETHTVELWIAAHAADHPGARVLTDLLHGRDLRSRLAGLPAYELIGA